jgi:transcriptional regulator with XRE-family HTH domain
MPRPNQSRTIASEANVARRVAALRESRGLSYEALANLMTDVGCAMQGTAIYRIEKGTPPRRVTLDETVAFAKVFGLSLDQLLTPIELIEQRRAKELIDELDHVTELLAETTTRMFNMYAEYFMLAASNPELSEYVEHHWEAATENDFPVAAMLDGDGELTNDTRLNDLSRTYSGILAKMGGAFADDLVRLVIERGGRVGENLLAEHTREGQDD